MHQCIKSLFSLTLLSHDWILYIPIKTDFLIIYMNNCLILFMKWFQNLSLDTTPFLDVYESHSKCIQLVWLYVKISHEKSRVGTFLYTELLVYYLVFLNSGATISVLIYNKIDPLILKHVMIKLILIFDAREYNFNTTYLHLCIVTLTSIVWNHI